MNLLEFLKGAAIEDLHLSESVLKVLQEQKMDMMKIHAALQAYKVFGKCTIKNLGKEEIDLLNEKYNDLLAQNGLLKGQNDHLQESLKSEPSALSDVAGQIPSRNDSNRSQPIASVSTLSTKERGASKTKPVAQFAGVIVGPTSKLSIWEERLVPQLRRAELVGEVPISKTDLEDIAQHIRQLFQEHSEETVLAVFHKYYPATFLVFMVGLGIHGYDQGDFWPAYESALNKRVDHSAFGQLFEKLLRIFGKPQFPDLQRKSLRYVSLILAHGGVPVYCLKDFFGNVVRNCAIRPQLLALDGRELVEDVLKHPAYTANTDKPVIYFLEYGGATAANFLDRCKQLLVAWQQTHTVLSANEIGLPPHIIKFFETWVLETPSLLSERGTRGRLKRPQLSLDPWGLGIFLLLPSQPVSALSVQDLAWMIESGDYRETFKARTQRKGDQVETREVTVRLNHISEDILIQFLQGHTEFEWRLKGSSSDNLIVAFDPATGRIQSHILARQNWLLYPRDLVLSVLEGHGELLEILPELPGDLSEFKVECWDLAQTVRLGIQQNTMSREIFVHSQEEREKPYLEGRKLAYAHIDENAEPVYIGIPPILHVPLSRSDDLQLELNRWQIKIENLGPADPEISKEFMLANIAEDACLIANDQASLRLEADSLLGRRPIGQYQLTLKGPLGRDATLLLKTTPELAIDGVKNLYIPDAIGGAEIASFSIRTSLLERLDVLNGADGIKVEHKYSGEHEVKVPATISLVELEVRRESLNHELIRVPISFRINRLRWRLVLDNGLVENWLQKHVTLLIHELLQKEAPILIVDLPTNDGDSYNLLLAVRDVEGKVLQWLKPADRVSKTTHRFWRFDLSQIKHILEKNDSPVIHLDLIGSKNSTETNEFQVPALVLNREIKLDQLYAETHSSAEQYHVLVTWKEKRHLRSRALVLWSLFRPWQQPIVISIPDDANGKYEFVINRQENAGGLYRTQMIVVDPWLPVSPPLMPPQINSIGCYDFEFTSPHETLQQLEQQINTMLPTVVSKFNSHIEASIIRQYQGELQTAYHHLAICCRDLLPATSREILTLSSILASMDSSILHQDFSMQIARPEILRKLYDKYFTGEISLTDFKSILQFAPPSKTWSPQVCELLIKLEDPTIRFQALSQLISKDMARAVTLIVDLLEQSKLSVEDAVALLYEEKPIAMEQIRKRIDDPIAKQLKDLLSRYNPYSGLPVIHPGSWVLTNAGWGMIEEILDPLTRLSMDRFIEGAAKYLLSVRLNINESHDLSGEKAVVNMAEREIVFLRATKIFVCQICGKFATAKLEIFKYHMSVIHASGILYPGERKNTIVLEEIQFNMNPRQRFEEKQDDSK
jgi:hypothetical protein